MNFASPNSLIWLALAVPIVIFYILKIRLRRQPVSTVMFWKQVLDEQNPRSIWQRLRHLVSLLLQLAMLLLLALVIAAVLMAKLTFVSIIALLYGWRDVTGVQFFNFIRVLILSLSLIAMVSLFCFSMGITVDYFILLKAGCALLAVGAGLLYFKLQARTVFRSFHLFSYLCATEIFPLVILVKVLLF